MTVKITSFIEVKYRETTQVIKELKKIPEVVKILSITGDFDILIDLVSEKTEDFVKILEKIETIPFILKINSHFVMKEWDK